MEDFIRQRLTVDRRKGLSVTRTPSGKWQAQTDNPDGSSTVHVGDDPVDALWNVLTPYQMHRRASSGRLLAPAGTPPPADDLDALLGGPPAIADDLAGLL